MSSSSLFSCLRFVYQSTFIAAIRLLQTTEQLQRELALMRARPNQCLTCPLAAKDKPPHDDSIAAPAHCSCLETLARRIDPRRM